jgi:hypothetical protein
MAGITTSETMAGEQPKDDVLGSRVDELTVQVDELRKLERRFGQFQRLTDDRLVDADFRLDNLEKKANGRKTKR